jgi:hypothetical protein
MIEMSPWTTWWYQCTCLGYSAVGEIGLKGQQSPVKSMWLGQKI